MAKLDYTESIPVLRGHLETIYEALDTAYGHNVALDLARQYQNVGGTHRPSNLTRKLEKALNHTEGYLETEDMNDLPEE